MLNTATYKDIIIIYVYCYFSRSTVCYAFNTEGTEPVKSQSENKRYTVAFASSRWFNSLTYLGSFSSVCVWREEMILGMRLMA